MKAAGKRKYIVLAAVNGAAALLFVIFLCMFSHITGNLDSQHTVRRWSSGEKYTQLSVFYSSLASVDLNTIYTMRVDIESKLKENSIASEKENARLWIDAYSSQGKLKVYSSRTDYTASCEAEVTATGGDFFIFHPVRLISGSYYSDKDLMQDRVIIDENMAWQLFGSSDVEGMTVLINGIRYYIAGVAECEKGKEMEYVCGDKPRMYISYAAYKRIYQDIDVPITSYEVCLPDPVSGLGEKILSEVLSADEEQRQIVENSERYSLKSLYPIAFDGGKRSIIDSTVIYPFWENAARMTEDKAADVLLAMTVTLVVPLVTLIYFAWMLYRKRGVIKNALAEQLRKIIYKIKIKVTSWQKAKQLPAGKGGLSE